MAYQKINSQSVMLEDGQSELYIVPGTNVKIIGRRAEATTEEKIKNREYLAHTVKNIYKKQYNVTVNVTFNNVEELQNV